MSRRVRIGKFSDGGEGIRVARPGFDADENPPDDRHLSFSSDWLSMMPILETGSFSVPSDDFDHYYSAGDLGYIPFFLAGLAGSNGSTVALSYMYIFDYGSSWVCACSDRLNIFGLSGVTIVYTIFKIRAF